MRRAVRRGWDRVGRVWLAFLVLALAGCGGNTVEPGNAAGSDSAADESIETGSDAGTDGAEADAGEAMATLTVAGEVYTWTSDQATVCAVDGVFPANADFGVPPSQGGEGPWVQFIDRGDGGINFSAVIDGEEYSGTGSGAADEIRSDGFTYTGTMSRSGESLDVELEVSC